MVHGFKIAHMFDKPDKGGNMTEKYVLLLGAGFVSTTVIEYLTRREENIVTIATRSISKAEQKRDVYAHNPKQIRIEALDIDSRDDDAKLDRLIGENDIVISLVPYSYHVKVAELVLNHNANGHKVHMITSSYISPEMQKLDARAKELGVVIMNGIGIDPGVDHLYTIKFIEEAHRNGGKVRHFESWCGGLPAPDNLQEGNPLKYKFSWSPRGVLMAGNNEARYLKDGKPVIVSPQELLSSGIVDLCHLHPDFDFEGYPNRDSTIYAAEYNIPEAQFILRGTLRYKGFAEFMRYLKASGLVNFDTSQEWKGLTWAQASQKVFNAASTSVEDLSKALLHVLNLDPKSDVSARILSGFEWIGIFSDTPLHNASTLGDSLSHLMEQKMSFKKGERDMIFMQNKLIIDLANGDVETITATLVLYGDNEGMFTAMAMGTGYPCVIATQLILDEVITRTGVFAPYYEEINEPIMNELKKVGIEMQIKRQLSST